MWHAGSSKLLTEVGFQIVDVETVKIDLVQSVRREICRKLTAPAAESCKHITILLGKKRYTVEVTMKAENLKPKPAPLIPLPIDAPRS